MYTTEQPPDCDGYILRSTPVPRRCAPTGQGALAASGKHYNVKVDPENLHRLIAWLDACSPFMGEEELRALGDPDFPGIETLPIRPLVATAPAIERP